MSDCLAPLPGLGFCCAGSGDLSNAQLVPLARRLMAEIDALYEAGGHESMLALESRLEEILWHLDHVLEALHGEGGGDPDTAYLVASEYLGSVDDEAGVEEQFIYFYRCYLDAEHPSFGNRPETCEAALRDVLESACLRGMAPRGLRIPPGTQLLPVARQLHQDRLRLTGRYRNSQANRTFLSRCEEQSR